LVFIEKAYFGRLFLVRMSINRQFFYDFIYKFENYLLAIFEHEVSEGNCLAQRAPPAAA